MGISITRYGGCMSIRTVHTLTSVWNEILEKLNREDDKGVTLIEHFELTGSVAVMQALLDEDLSSFDAEEFIEKRMVYGVVINDNDND